jgi:hypothetical protein
VITLARFQQLEAILRAGGYGPTIDWSETIQPARSADEFAERAIYVICNSGMRVTVATGIFQRCMASLRLGASAASVFGHEGKSAGIDRIWRDRRRLFDGYQATEDPLVYLESLPWIGPVTRHHLAKNLGANEAKPDVHMERLAKYEGTTTAELCTRLSHQSGYRAATIDSILWRACADGILNSRIYAAEGWEAAFRG